MSYESNSDDVMEKGQAFARDDGGDAGDLKYETPPVTPNSATTTSNLLKTDNISDAEQNANTRELFSGLKSKVSNWMPKLSNDTPSGVAGRRSRVRVLEECPTGYPRLAAFLDSDENFMLYRRFGYLQSRILLYKQDELRGLERQLDNLDKLDAEIRPKMLKSRERDDAENHERRNLILKISGLWKEYAELLKTSRELASFNRPPTRDYESVTNYFNQNDPICNPESYIYHKEEIVSLKPGRETAWLDTVVEKILQKLHSSFIQHIFCSEDLRRKASTSTVVLYSRERINFFVSLIITIMILALLIIPVYLLWNLTRANDFTNNTTAIIMGILLVFTLVFSAVLSLFTRAKRHEILAAAAGYCAVLVVFIGNIGQLDSR